MRKVLSKETGKAKLARLHIYLSHPAIRMSVKAAAAEHDTSLSEYCTEAIVKQLGRDGFSIPRVLQSTPLARGLEKARTFQLERFKDKHFTVCSAELLRQARRER